MSTHQYTSRPYDEARDRPEYRRWSKAHGVVDVSADLLAPAGAVIEDETGRPCAMGWVYLDTSHRMAFAAWMTAGPELSAREVESSIQYLMAELADSAATLGAKLLYTTAPASMGGALGRIGFIKNHPVLGYWKPLCNLYNIGKE